MEKIVRLRYLWFAISLLVIIPGTISLLLPNQLQVGIDFAGGTLWDVRFSERAPEQISADALAEVFAAHGFPDAQVQFTTSQDTPAGTTEALVRTVALDEVRGTAQREEVFAALTEAFGAVEFVELQSVGATVSQESTTSAVFAVLGASLAILVYLTLAFRRAPHPFRYGVCAILAMLHDVVLVLGVASLLGRTIGLEVDALFLTALLTVISFSVHDTIVVFDRVRENLIGRRTGESFEDIVNHSIVQTLPRSINTQLTSLFTLVALLLFGGESIHDFVLILTIGLISGTYSSIFNAAQLLVVWENHEWRTWFRRREPAVA